MMKLMRPAVAAASIAAAALCATGSAHAGNVYWSVGVNAAPGVMLGVGNAPFYPRVYAPAPVYVAPAPVFYAPPPVVYSPVTYVRPASIYYRPYAPVVMVRKHGRRWHH